VIITSFAGTHVYLRTVSAVFDSITNYYLKILNNCFLNKKLAKYSHKIEKWRTKPTFEKV